MKIIVLYRDSNKNDEYDGIGFVPVNYYEYSTSIEEKVKELIIKYNKQSIYDEKRFKIINEEFLNENLSEWLNLLIHGTQEHEYKYEIVELETL